MHSLFCAGGCGTCPSFLSRSRRRAAAKGVWFSRYTHSSSVLCFLAPPHPSSLRSCCHEPSWPALWKLLVRENPPKLKPPLFGRRDMTLPDYVRMVKIAKHFARHVRGIRPCHEQTMCGHGTVSVQKIFED